MQSAVAGGPRSTACLRGERREACGGGLPFQRLEKSVVIRKKGKIKTQFALETLAEELQPPRCHSERRRMRQVRRERFRVSRSGRYLLPSDTQRHFATTSRGRGPPKPTPARGERKAAKHRQENGLHRPETNSNDADSRERL